MKIKVYPDKLSRGGISSVIEDHRILLAQHQFVETEQEADLIIVHANTCSIKYEPDITHTHGIYPTQDLNWGINYQKINDQIFNNVSASINTVAVSQWGGALLHRYTGINPHVIHNGIFYKNYQRKGNKLGPSFWGKTDINPICSPTSFIELTQRIKGVFASFHNLPNSSCIEKMNRVEIKRFLETCGLLIATTKENDSMLIMEAMASGVPVLAYKWGMTKDRLTHKIGCYLAEPNNIEDLIKGYYYLKENWQSQSEMAYTFAGWFDWELQKPKLESLFTQTLKEKHAPQKVSIVIPCHNYSAYVSNAIESAKSQSVPCEIIVVNDGSTDDSGKIIAKSGVNKIINHDKPRGVAQSRNEAISQANGNFIVCLDADDTLEPDFVEQMLTGMTTRKTAICFSPIKIIDTKGNSLNQMMFNTPPDPNLHKKGFNQVPSCCLFRKTWWDRSDGYDHYLTFSEDANLWLKMFILGGIAKIIGNVPLMNYRRHDKNHSLNPMSKWDIFHSPTYVIHNESDLSLLVVGDEFDAKHSSWRLKDIPYNITVKSLSNTSEQPSNNYLFLEASPDILEKAQELLSTCMTQQFLYQHV